MRERERGSKLSNNHLLDWTREELHLGQFVSGLVNDLWSSSSKSIYQSIVNNPVIDCIEEEINYMSFDYTTQMYSCIEYKVGAITNISRK